MPRPAAERDRRRGAARVGGGAAWGGGGAARRGGDATQFRRGNQSAVPRSTAARRNVRRHRSSKMALEIQLINQIEKHALLYNFNLPEYNRKDLVEDAWENIAANTSLSISDCKEKWRNIRSSFLRSMKPSGYKVKKPYYLSEYLKFILPFLKPINGIETDDYDSQQNTTSDVDVVVDYIKTEPTDGDNEENIENNDDNTILSDLLARKTAALRKKRKLIPKKNCTEIRNRGKLVTSSFQRNYDTVPELNSSNNNAMRMFLMSLLPELETMTDDQVRMFKIKSMMLIDEIKVNCTQVRKDLQSNNNVRLQKRLINLLLKNLQSGNNGNAS